jgi:putative Holliday junction resolvase
MTIVTIGEIAAHLSPGQRLMGLDVGSKTVGIAVSDAGLTIATPIETLRRTKFRADAAKLGTLFEQRHVGGLIIGLPVNMDGSEGPRCQSVRQFAANLLDAYDLPIAFWDERLSTAAVTRTLLDADLSRKRRGEVVDKLAAAFILQGALDGLAHLRRTQ